MGEHGGYLFPNDLHILWELMIVMYPYVTGLVAGAFILSSLYHVFNRRELRPIGRLALVASLGFLIFAPFTLLLHLEDLGFCAKGEGGPFVEDGKLGPGGSLPTNTNGGGLSYTHPGMYGMFLVVEAVRQLRGDAGPRQVTGSEVAVAHGSGMVLSCMSTVVLGTEATL